ncbi:MAG: HEPN domain-containing protein [Candidatus Latescibacteria bacterium]|nr:HEPN domain-containing protein [Candidatus Latescibacterota bacterium]
MFAHQWLEKAETDVITARQTLTLADGPTDTPCFHAQQAVEKSLK